MPTEREGFERKADSMQNVGQMKTEQPKAELTQEPLTFGQRLVGITFNPSNNPKVDRAKQLCAELADLIQKDRMKYNNVHSDEINPAEGYIFSHAIGAILDAQMNVVKLLTLK
jgi:hypothetical protein